MEYQFKIKLRGITKPPVWRSLIVPAEFTFHRFHYVIQAVFGWENCHLFKFEDKEYNGNIHISLPSRDPFEFRNATMDATKVKLSDIFSENIDKLLYVYDFGDNWVHEITLEAVVDDKREEAFCLSGKGNCPPEDCGGSPGYENMKKALKTKPISEEGKGYREWLGMYDFQTWDTTSFSVKEANELLKQI